MPSTQTSRLAALALPNPMSRVEDASPGDGDAAHRNLYCLHYGDCLLVAARKGWGDWSCEACALNVSVEPPGAVQWAEARIRRD